MTTLQNVKLRIQEAAKDGAPPTLVAVSKFQPLEKMMAVYQEGHRIFGENYVQELIEKKQKFEALGLADLDFHFIGHLQTKKVKALLAHTQTIHSVDSIKLLEEIANRAQQLNKKIGCYFEVNIDQEHSKHGFFTGELLTLQEKLPQYRASINALGLMCIPDPQKNSREAFSNLRKLRDEYVAFIGNGLSMGMSQDFEIAITEGSTIVRIGSEVFGERK